MGNSKGVMGLLLCAAVSSCVLQTGEAGTEQGAESEPAASADPNAAPSESPEENLDEFQGLDNSVTIMAPSSKSMCAFTRIGGIFMGSGEAAQIREENGSWVLRTAKGAKADNLRAWARCFSRDQTG